jgi:hypothetical protein
MDFRNPYTRYNDELDVDFCSSMVEPFRWPVRLARGLVLTLGPEAVRDSALCNAEFMSEFCAGLGSAGHGCGSMTRAMSMYDIDIPLHSVCASAA